MIKIPATRIRLQDRWEGKIEQSVLTMIKLRCLLDIKVEKLRHQADTSVVKSRALGQK